MEGSSTFEPYRPDRSSARKGKLGLNEVAAVAFVRCYAEVHGPIDHIGTKRAEREHVNTIPSNTNKQMCIRSLKAICLIL